jgi:hypothetical protein
MCAKRRARNADQSGRSRSIEISLEINGCSFTFPLFTRPLNVGLDSLIQYYWIDHSLLRESAANRSANLCDRIVNFWQQAMVEARALNEPEQLETYLLARCYRVLSSNRGMQRVFLDAHSGHHADRDNNTRAIELPDDVRASIRKIVERRNMDGLRNEFAALFNWQPIPEEHREALNNCYDNWVGFGARQIAENPQTSSEEFVKTIEYWDNLLGNNSRTAALIRTFRNRFAYECKCAFYTCYIQLWSKLIHELRERHQLDEVSTRFLCFWHMQNPPVQTLNAQGQTSLEPDVFFGQVLALHPLSGCFMLDPALLAIAGRLLGSDAWQAVFENGDARRQEYWDLIEAILVAGHMYQINDTRQRNARGHRQSSIPRIELVASPAVSSAEDLHIIENFAAALRFNCAKCGSTLQNLELSVSDEVGVSMFSGRCRHCAIRRLMQVTFEQIRDALRRQTDAESE